MSGMKPPSARPSKQRVAKKEARPLSLHCSMATRLQKIIWMGIQRSAPIFLLISCAGISMNRKETTEERRSGNSRGVKSQNTHKIWSGPCCSRWC